MGRLVVGFALAGALWAADWPQFLGPNRDGVYTGEIEIAWAEAEPPMVWKKEVGEGFAGPVVANGRLVLCHRVGGREIVDCVDADTGKPIWQFDYPTSYRDDFGFDEGPRAAPLIHGGRVYTFGAQGVLHCLRFENGGKVWSVDTHERFGVRKGFFGAASGPLFERGKLIVNVGGADGAGIVAFDAETGEVAWKATDDPAGYSTGVAATIGDERRAFFFTRTGLVDLDPADGRVRSAFRWRSRSNASVNAAAPVVAGDRVFLSASYGTGAVLLRLGSGEPEEIWRSEEALSNHYATSVHAGGYLYGYHGRQEFGPALRSIRLATGEVQWSEERFGAGTVMLAGGRLLLMRDSGELVVAPATPDGFRPEFRAKLLPGTVRAYPALAGGRLYVRNGDTLACFQIEKK